MSSAFPRGPARIAARPPPSGWESQFPSCVPPSWFLTTLTAYSSVTSQPCCMLLPILGFTAFPPVAKQDSPPCTCCPSKLSLRRQRRKLGRILAFVGSRHRSDRLRPSRSPRTLPSRPFPHRTSDAVSRILRRDEPRPQGLAPSSGPLRGRTFPSARARCSLGLGRLVRPRLLPVSSPRTGRTVQKTRKRKPTSRQRPFRRMTPSV